MQVDLLYPAFLMYSAYGYATNATGFTATYAGPDVTLAVGSFSTSITDPS